MGRFADLCATLAAEADESSAGISLPPELGERLRDEGWAEEDLQDAAEFVRLSLLQMELTQASDSLSASLVEWLGSLSAEETFRRLTGGELSLPLDIVSGLVRRVTYLEEVLALARDDEGPDLSGLIELSRRLAGRDDA
jgi:hypothetical protein